MKIPEQSISFDPTFIVNRELFSVFYSDVYLSEAGVKALKTALPAWKAELILAEFSGNEYSIRVSTHPG